MRCSGEVIPPIDREKPLFQRLFTAIFSASTYWLIMDLLFLITRMFGLFENSFLMLFFAPLIYAIPLCIGMVIGFAYLVSMGRSRKFGLYITLACCMVMFFFSALLASVLPDMMYQNRGIVPINDLSELVFTILTCMGLGLLLMLDRSIRGVLGILIGAITFWGLLTITLAILMIYHNATNIAHFDTGDYTTLFENISLRILIFSTPAIAWISARLVEQWHVRRALRYGGTHSGRHMM